MLESVDEVHVQDAGNALVENGPPVFPDLLDVVRQTLELEITESVGMGRRRSRVLRHPRVVGRRVRGDLRRLAGSVVRNRSVDLRRGRAGCRGSTDSSLVSRARGRGALRRLRRETARRGTLGILLLEWRLLGRRGRRRRRTLESGRCGGHVRRLLLLLLRMRRRSQAALRDLPGEDRPDDRVVSWVTDLRGRLRRGDMLRRRVHGTRRTSAALQLAAQHGNLLLVSDVVARVRAVRPSRIKATRDSLLFETHLGLFHLIDLLTYHLHFLYLSLDYRGKKMLAPALPDYAIAANTTTEPRDAKTK